MPRGNRLGTDGGVFHVTQRCHNRQFLLKFARDRDAYRARLRGHLSKYDVWMLDYCLTWFGLTVAKTIASRTAGSVDLGGFCGR
jgi:hypothetical protein